MSSKSTSSTVLVASTAAAACTVVTAAICYWLQRNQSQQLRQEWEKRRGEERTGRIRAEVKLRALLNEQKGASVSASKDTHAMNMSCIGTIVSPYTKRMGTPRQGALVPSSRAFVQLSSALPREVLEGIDEYSHVWIIFGFHANTSLATSRKTKVRPPRGGGIKVGQLSTRSPHRPNPIGLSLVKLDRWEPSTRRLFLSALDLVNGTPVYDIKPYVQWDIPGDLYDKSILKVPAWVESKDDVLPDVQFSSQAEQDLVQLVRQNLLAPLYPSKDKSAFEAARQTLTEILAQDPRSSHKAAKNQRGSFSSETYQLLFGKAEIEFLVRESGALVVRVAAAAPDGDTDE
jgi:tRNA-Thr(GGU) m(6)t(6)A37 methyltransferase TsaA